MIPAAVTPLNSRPADARAAPAVGAAGHAATGEWQRLWRDAIRDPRELLDLLDLAPLAARLSNAVAVQTPSETNHLGSPPAGVFPLRVPRGFASRMRRGDPDDPLLRQVLPLDDEDRVVPGFGLDAVGDADASAGAGVLRKYRGRALLVATGSCAVHCRYCFRRHFPYAEETAARERWREAVALIGGDAGIDEVILSGGDPLSLSTPKLAQLTDALRGAPHLKRLRIHTRLPVVLPERVDAPLLDWLRTLPWPVTVVVHANHANEFDASVDQAMSRLRDAGATLLNQAVLLRGVNDSVDALADLGERSHAAGVLPYYLHQLDRVAGTAHFEVDDDRARALHRDLAARLSGYLVPRLVREIAGDPGKRPL